MGALTSPPSVLAVLYPAVAHAAHRAGAERIGIVDATGVHGPNLDLDRVGITYADGVVLGDPSEAVQVSSTRRGDRPVPVRAVPELVSRTAIDLASQAKLPDAIGAVPADAPPVVTTTWALSALGLDDRLQFLHALDAAATDRAVAWVSVEGVGVAPGVPTMGDRRASGHSIVAVARFEHDALTVEVVGRCWSRGRWLSWLAD